MNKSKLTPFDGDLLAMIADVAKVQPKVTENEKDFVINVQPELTMKGETMEALGKAVAGRLGDRLLGTSENHGVYSFRISYSPEEYPEESRDFAVAIDPAAGQRYCRTLQEVNAIQVDREKLEELKAFTGGGMLTIPREPNARAMYTFPNGNGMLVDVPETFFIVRDDANDFTTMHPKEFARMYEPKGIRTVGNYDSKPQPTAKDKAVDVVHNISPGLRYMVDERLEQLFLGRNVEHDNKENAAGELLDVAAALVKNDPDLFGRSGWSWDWWEKTTAKPEKERLAIAGALIAAEIDREETNRVAYEKEIAARNDNNNK